MENATLTTTNNDREFISWINDIEEKLLSLDFKERQILEERKQHIRTLRFLRSLEQTAE